MALDFGRRRHHRSKLRKDLRLDSIECRAHRFGERGKGSRNGRNVDAMWNLEIVPRVRIPTPVRFGHTELRHASRELQFGRRVTKSDVAAAVSGASRVQAVFP